MRASNDHPLRLVDPARRGVPSASAPGAGDLGLIVTLLSVNLVPIVGELARAGRFGSGTVGFATACALVMARELWLELRSLVQARASRERPRGRTHLVAPPRRLARRRPVEPGERARARPRA